MKTPRSGTARRLGLAFAALVALFTLSSLVALWHLRQVHLGLVQMQAQQRTLRSTLEVASAVRDVYAHQAHTLILGDTSHLPYYDTTARRVAQLSRELRGHVQAADERGWAADIGGAQEELDRHFREQLVPAVLARQTERVQAEHGRSLELVKQMEERTGRLVQRSSQTLDALEARVGRLERAALGWLLFFLVAAPALAAVVGVALLHSVVRPLARLHEGAVRLAAGDMETRIHLDSPDEFGALARQFNAMTQALREHQERLVQSEKLAGIGRLAAGVAHELNNPLAVILGYLKLMKKKAHAQLAEDLRVLEEEALRSQEIVEGLLDLSRPLAIEPRPVDLRAVCDEAVTRLGEANQLGGASVAVEGAANVRGHPAKLRQVVLNLVKNAAEAAGPEGRVSVRLGASERGAELHVVDDGPGLTPRARERLFEPFFTTKSQGTGLGLAVCQGIVRAHGGDIEVETSPPPGAHFIVRLPASPAPGRV